MKGRIELVRDKLNELELDGVMINNQQNIYYLSGFTGTAGTVLITAKTAVLITDFRYIEQAKKQASDYEVVKRETPKFETLSQELKRLNIKRLGFEAGQETYKQYQKYKKKLDFLELVATENLIEGLREQKNSKEVETIKGAIEIADKAFEHIQDYIEIGLTEKEISLELEYFMKQQGASENAFDFIVASGKRGALPHGVATDKELKPGEMVTLDFGCVYNCYNSDLTRNIILGTTPTQKQEKVYQTVLSAQLAAIEAIEPGKTGAEIDQVAREIISQAGYGDRFGHSLGHGVGLEVHEEPRLAKKVDEELKPGMVVTVEPGIYIPDWGGIRIEDVVVVTKAGCEILTGSPKELIKI